MKLLLIEDNKRLAESVKKQLHEHYLIDLAYTGQDGVEKAKTTDYAVIVLDLGLPDLPGFSVCKRLRSANVTAPILILTGVDEMKTRIDLLNCGADDYMTKPFNRKELQARVGALARRRSHAYAKPTLEVQDLVINTQERKVYRSGVHIPLRRKEFDILEYLVNNSGRVLTREMILNHAWDTGKSGWHNTVDVHIKHLRDKIDRPFESPIIKTAYGLGYKVDTLE